MKIGKRRLSKHKRKGDAYMHLQDVLKKPSMTARDKEILIALYNHRCLTTNQIEEMFFRYNSDGKENAYGVVVARRRIRNLFDNCLVDRFFVDVGDGMGSSQGHIILDQLGAKVVAGLLNMNIEDLNWRYEMNEASLPYLGHMVSVNDFYLYLLRKARAEGHEVTEYKVENHVRHEFKYWGKNMVFNPDAYGQYWIGEEGIHFFLEWDNSTMTPLTFQKKIQRYTAFYASGEFEAIYGEFPLVLTVTPTMERATQLRKIVEKGNKSDIRWLFTSEDRVKDNPLGRIWLGLHIEEPVGLF